MKNTLKAKYKDLELQIDYLTGYTPLGLHWKKEYYARSDYISGWLQREDVPGEVKAKVERLQEVLLEMRTERTNKPQPYITPEFFADEFFYNRFNEERTIVVNDRFNGRTYTL